MRQYLIALSAVAMVAATPVVAKDFVVVHEDLNLSTAKGQKELKRRIDSAARDYCGVGRKTVGSNMQAQGTATCYRDARTAAREQMDVLISKAQLGG